MSWCRTAEMPCGASLSSTDFAPGARSGQRGSSGSIRAHKPSSTIQGRVVTRRERSNHHIGNARPGHPNKILLRAQRPVSVLTGPQVQRIQAYNRTEFVGVRSVHRPVEQLLPMSQATLPVALYPVQPCTRAPPVWQFTTVYSPTRFCTLYVP